MITYRELQENKEIQTYITRADESLRALGFTEHSFAHVNRVAQTAAYILETLGYDAHTVELCRIAGYLHDIGNLVNRRGAFAKRRSDGLSHSRPAAHGGGRHRADCHSHRQPRRRHGRARQSVAAALILADKSDVRRSRVRNADFATFDIHDRVNYSVEKSILKINEEKTLIKLKLQIDRKISSVMDYFEIFLDRMTLCRRAAEKLGLQFKLIINEQQLI